MFTVKSGPQTVTWTVKGRQPADGGRFRPFQFDCAFKIFPADEFAEMIDRLDSAERGDDGEGRRLTATEQSEKIIELLEEVIAGEGWGETIKDEDGNPIPYDDPEKRHQILNITYVRAALMAAFQEAQSGGAQRKN